MLQATIKEQATRIKELKDPFRTPVKPPSAVSPSGELPLPVLRGCCSQGHCSRLVVVATQAARLGKFVYRHKAGRRISCSRRTSPVPHSHSYSTPPCRGHRKPQRIGGTSRGGPGGASGSEGGACLFFLESTFNRSDLPAGETALGQSPYRDSTGRTPARSLPVRAGRECGERGPGRRSSLWRRTLRLQWRRLWVQQCAPGQRGQ